jgi:hypothetical protein
MACGAQGCHVEQLSEAVAAAFARAGFVGGGGARAAALNLGAALGARGHVVLGGDHALHLGFDLPEVPLEQRAAFGGQAFEQGQAGGVPGLVDLVLEHLDQGLARLQQLAQHRLGLNRRAARAQPLGVTHVQAEQACVYVVGLGQDALGLANCRTPLGLSTLTHTPA